MNCNETQSNFDDYLDDLIDAGQRVQVDFHLESCQVCQSVLAEERKLRNNLRALPVPRLSDGFADRAVRVAMHSAVSNRHRSGYMKGFSSAIAAGLAVWFFIGPFPSINSPSLKEDSKTDDPYIQEISIELHQMRKVKLAFHTLRAMGGATISISLPDNVVIVGYENRRKLEWQTDLVRGDNVLTLPIKAMVEDTGELIAQLKYVDKVKTVKINLAVHRSDVTEPSVFDRTEGQSTVA